MLAKGLKVLIIGGGFSGMTAAIQLRKAGADVEIVEIDPGWRILRRGHHALAARASGPSREIGVLDEFLKRGDAADGARSVHRGGQRSRASRRRALRARMCPGGADHAAASSPPFSRRATEACRDEGPSSEAPSKRSSTAPTKCA